MNVPFRLSSSDANRRPGKELKWDSAALKITNDEAADKLLRRSYREFA